MKLRLPRGALGDSLLPAMMDEALQQRIEDAGVIAVVTIDSAEQAELQNEMADCDNPHSDQFMYEQFEDMIANSELTWVNPVDTGDMTEAPMLGILGNVSTSTEGPFGSTHVGYWDNAAQYQPIISRFAFMNYMLRSPIEELASNGEVIFVS